MKKVTAGMLINAPADSGRGARNALRLQPFPWGTLANLIPTHLAEDAMRRLPDFLLDYGKLPIITCPDNVEIEVVILSVPFTSRALLDPAHRYHKQANERLLSAPKLLVKNHPEIDQISVLGLGAATAIAGGHGREIHRRYGYKFGNFPIVTSGNTITAGLAVLIASQVTKKKRIRSIGIFGSTGSVGSRVLDLAVEEFEPDVVYLYYNPDSTQNHDRNLEQIRQEFPNIQFFRGSMKETVACQLVFMASSSTVPFDIVPSWPISGGVIIDIGRPLNTPPRLKIQRPDLSIIDGSLASLPKGTNWQQPCQRMGLSPNTVFGCLAETIVLAHQYRLGNLSTEAGSTTFIGRPDATQAKIMISWLKQTGLAPVVAPAH